MARRSPSICTKPGRPPRWDMSSPPIASGRRMSCIVDAASLDVLGAIAKALADGNSESADISIGDMAVGTVAPSRREIETENADLLAARNRPGGRIECVCDRIDAQGDRIGTVNKARFPCQHGRERPAIGIGDR